MSSFVNIRWAGRPVRIEHRWAGAKPRLTTAAAPLVVFCTKAWSRCRCGATLLIAGVLLWAVLGSCIHARVMGALHRTLLAKI